MRLKTLTAPTMPEALRLIRTQLGQDALILSTRKIKTADGIETLEITAALPDNDTETPTLPAPQFTPQDTKTKTQDTPKTPLSAHLLPKALEERLKTATKGLVEANFSEEEALEMTLPKILPLTTPAGQLTGGMLHVFVGPHGAGKTTLMGKLALQAAASGQKVGLMSLD
ncbi:MAG: hypothetical protein COY40_06425, partial [Alphaproteobacteria bacterium CG_4_10_14_0_8_um_filter_53_9]